MNRGGPRGWRPGGWTWGADLGGRTWGRGAGGPGGRIWRRGHPRFVDPEAQRVRPMDPHPPEQDFSRFWQVQNGGFCRVQLSSVMNVWPTTPRPPEGSLNPGATPCLVLSPPLHHTMRPHHTLSNHFCPVILPPFPRNPESS